MRPLLHRIADALLLLKAHYRFYFYTRAAIAIDGTKDPPPKDASYWATITQPIAVEDPAPPAPPLDPGGVPPIPDPTSHTEYVPIGGVDWAVGTHPMACATFVWASIRTAEKAMGARKIVVEGPVEALDNSGKPHRSAGSQDGLYAYTETERQKSDTSLHAALDDQMHESLEEQQSGLIGLVAVFATWVADLSDNVATQIVCGFAVNRGVPDSQRSVLRSSGACPSWWTGAATFTRTRRRLFTDRNDNLRLS